MDITNSGFLTQLNTVNSTVHAVFTTTGTMAASIAPADVVYAVNQAYRNEQVTVNNAATAAPYINTVSPFAPQVVLFDADGNPYQDLVATVRIRRELVVDNIAGAEGTVRI